MDAFVVLLLKVKAGCRRCWLWITLSGFGGCVLSKKANHAKERRYAGDDNSSSDDPDAKKYAVQQAGNGSMTKVTILGSRTTLHPLHCR